VAVAAAEDEDLDELVEDHQGSGNVQVEAACRLARRPQAGPASTLVDSATIVCGRSARSSRRRLAVTG
jgi:hypothetical protein